MMPVFQRASRHKSAVRLALLGGVVLVCGCALNPGVATLGAGTFSVSRQAPLPIGGTDGLREQALRQAESHCAGSGAKSLVVRIIETKPPYLPDNMPRAEVQFRCERP